jgi:phage tail-like protein
MLPQPFEKYIPRFFKRDSKLIAFSDKINEILDSIRYDTVGLNDIVDPVKCPAIILDELGYFLNAGIKAQDSEDQKRLKIATAIQGHKKRGTFKFDAKPKIDAIAGGDSQIIRGFTGDDWIMGGDGETIPSSYYWASLGVDGIDDSLGISLIGEGIEIEVAGNIYIDVDNDSLSASEVQQIVDELEDDIVPAYFRVFIGYLDLGGNFVTYTYIE